MRVDALGVNVHGYSKIPGSRSTFTVYGMSTTRSWPIIWTEMSFSLITIE